MMASNRIVLVLALVLEVAKLPRSIHDQVNKSAVNSFGSKTNARGLRSRLAKRQSRSLQDCGFGALSTSGSRDA
ncbi:MULTISPECIES: hypothetical protein [unclassified Bradyrhizobium]|uniref:hypothetical protein n=2 Tax=unclassified Bradyrhizobium TaxID=2631580 RepID=UPI0028E3C3D4|nr:MULTISPECIES: hypothetical protein [unclassified Bradyrhizobium]